MTTTTQSLAPNYETDGVDFNKFTTRVFNMWKEPGQYGYEFKYIREPRVFNVLENNAALKWDYYLNAHWADVLSKNLNYDVDQYWKDRVEDFNTYVKLGWITIKYEEEKKKKKIKLIKKTE